MASTWTDVANGALLKLGGASITDFSDGSREADLTKQAYKSARDRVLQMHPWNCATKRQVLSPLTTAPEFGFGFKFQLPSDCLRVLTVNEPDVLDYSLEQAGELLCDLSTVDLKYITRLEDVTRIEPMVLECIEQWLAWQICFALTQSQSLKGKLFDDFYKVFLPKAKSVNAQQNSPGRFSTSKFLQARIAGNGSILRNY